MDIHSDYISYESTGHFTHLVIDYINKDEKLLPFYNHPVSSAGVEDAIAARKNFPVQRDILVTELRKQYERISLTARQEENLSLLLKQNTFTITTAHQPVIFTGPLYFIYKIVHAIKLADELSKNFSPDNFIPVFYMGSEDADLDELGQLYLDGEKLIWETDQTGAVGRMKVDNNLLKLINTIAGQIEIHPYGEELIALFKQAYREGITIQQATLHMVNELFKDHGLLVVIPDNEALKNPFKPIVKKELEEQFSHAIATQTIRQLQQHYKQQAGGREINLFYLYENNRERIEKAGEKFTVKMLKKEWTIEEILTELDSHPGRVSANVILRPLFQETILPDVIFIGGGGETAYWLELKKVFEAAGVYFPMLIVRNSFLFVNKIQLKKADKLGFALTDLFKNNEALLNDLVKRNSSLRLDLNNEKLQLQELYTSVKAIAGSIDRTLAEHTAALQHKAIEKLEALEKKMLRKEKRKFEAEQRQIQQLKQQLFPKERLQERVENFSTFYAKYGKAWLQAVYKASLGLEQQFAIVEMK